MVQRFSKSLPFDVFPWPSDAHVVSLLPEQLDSIPQLLTGSLVALHGFIPTVFRWRGTILADQEEEITSFQPHQAD